MPETEETETWNSRIDGLRRYVLFEGNMFRFHVSFWKCTLPRSYRAFEQSLDWKTFFMSVKKKKRLHQTNMLF